MTAAVPARAGRDGAWLLGLCASRAGFTLIFSIYSAMIPLVVAEWGMTAAQAGMIQTAWHAGYLGSLFAVGFLSDRYGAKRVYLAGSFAAAASAMAFALLSHDFASALVLHGLAGLCSGASYTPGLTLIAQRYESRRGRAMGWYLAAASIGYAASLVIGAAIAPTLGWRGAFVAAALGPLLATAIAFASLRRTPNVRHAPEARDAGASPIGAVLRNRPAMLTIWGYSFHSWELLGIKAWLPAFLAAAAAIGGAGVLEAVSLGALLTAVTYAASAAGGLFGGALSDRLGRTRTILLCSCASLACSFGFGWLLMLPLWLIVAAACVYIFAAIADSSVYSTAITELVPPHLVGAAYSVRSVLGMGIGGASPWAMGLVIDLARGSGAGEGWVWGLGWCALGVGALVGPLATWRLRRLPESARMAQGLR